MESHPPNFLRSFYAMSQEAYLKNSRICGIVCKIFGVEHFVVAEAAAAVIDDSISGNGKCWVSLKTTKQFTLTEFMVTSWNHQELVIIHANFLPRPCAVRRSISRRGGQAVDTRPTQEARLHWPRRAFLSA
jgi:hypothetical protein